MLSYFEVYKSEFFLTTIKQLLILLDAWPQPEGSYKIGTVCLSVHLSASFFRTSSLAFSETEHGVWGLSKLCVAEPEFSEKNPHWAKKKKKKKKSKMAKCMVFGLFKKIISLVLPGICVKWKFLWLISILQKLHACEKSGSQVIAKNSSRPMRFQYSLIINI